MSTTRLFFASIAIVHLVRSVTASNSLSWPLPVPEHFYGIVPIHYDFELTIPAGDREYDGTAKMTFKAAQDGLKTVRVHADGKSIAIQKAQLVTQDGNAQDVSNFVLLKHSQEASIHLDQPLATGAVYIMTIDYTGPPKSARNSYSTLFQPSFMRQVFPCVDEPAFKATFSTCIIHSAGSKVAGNTVEIMSETTSDGKQKTCFAKTKVIPTNVVSFAVMEDFQSDTVTYDIAGGRQLTSTFYKATDGQTTFERLRKWTPEHVRAMEEYFDMPFPVNKLDVHVHSSETKLLTGLPFAGAIENDGIIGFPNGVDEKTFLHEVVHHYVGNLVTVVNWVHFDLQEGITEYLNQKVGSDIGCQRCRKKPVSELLDLYNAPWSTFQLDNYERPGRIFHMFEDIFGYDVLQTVLREMFKEKSRSLISWDIFNEFLKKSSCGSQCAHFVEVWRSTKGFPVVHVKKSDTPNKYTVTQTFSKFGRNKNNTPLPLNLKYKSVGSDEVQKMYASEFPAELEVTGSGAFPMVNPEDDVFQLTVYDVETYKSIVAAFKSGEVGKDEQSLDWIEAVIHNFNMALDHGYADSQDFGDLVAELQNLL